MATITEDQRLELVRRVMSGEPLRAVAFDGGASPVTLSRWLARSADVARARGMIETGSTVSQAAYALGVSHATLARWLERYAQGGSTALSPAARPGRPAVAEVLSEEARRCLQEFYLRTNSLQFACRAFKDTPLCPPEIGEAIVKGLATGSLPLSLRRAAYVTPETKALYRGQRAFQYASGYMNRGNFWVDEQGQKHDLRPGDIFEMDDMSFNQPFWFENPDGDDPIARKYGKGIGRQSLHAMDVASGKWLGFELIGRPRDAYRAEDILRFCRKIFTEFGLPRVALRLEQGIWKSKAIKGFQLDGGDYVEGYVQQAMPEEDKARITEGLSALGVRVLYMTSSHGKGMIESSFNYFQTAMEAYT